ncbi:hypothetical protein BH09ACT5_BH09ACT5_03280 [soil metagenome]
MTPSDSPPPRLAELIRRATAADGSPPFSDGALVELAQGERELLWLGPAAALSKPGEAEFVVDPDARALGHGTRMLEALLGAGAGPSSGSGAGPSSGSVPSSGSGAGPSSGPGPVPGRGAGFGGHTLFWAHGDHPAARALAASHGLVRARELLHLEAAVPARPSAQPAGPGPQESGGNRLSAFTPADAHAWVELNARAFAGHPEQGAVTRADLDVLAAEPWFDPGDFLLLWDGAELIGYCWLKVDGGEGEFYVVGVSPDRQGEGIGRRLVAAGFARLASRGIRTAHLYVEGDNAAALALYRSFGFTNRSVDIQYSSSPAG